MFEEGRSRKEEGGSQMPREIVMKICGALPGRRYDVPLPAKHEKSRFIVKNPDSSCLNRVSHRVVFRRNRALSC